MARFGQLPEVARVPMCSWSSCAPAAPAPEAVVPESEILSTRRADVKFPARQAREPARPSRARTRLPTGRASNSSPRRVMRFAIFATLRKVQAQSSGATPRGSE
ncbi:MAG: hypothetical protein FD160_957 [Caulobacteraceae bacterium]|nr:MAG: hypothetical protein FD160_957 [Caulobacteraceae bacterium]